MPENGPTDVALLPVPGLEKTSDAFKTKVIQIASDLKVNPNFLTAVMSFESGESFGPSVKNAAGSGAVGLIQFMPATAKGLGTSTKALAAMTAEEQLDFVERHLRRFKGRLRTLEDLYMAVLLPSAVGKPNDHVLFRRGTPAYSQNAGLDADRNGEITKAEAAAKVREKRDRGRKFATPAAPAPAPALARGLAGVSAGRAARATPRRGRPAVAGRGGAGRAVAPRRRAAAL